MQPLDDGTYDAFIVDAKELEKDFRDRGVLELEIAITSGPRKGDVVQVRAVGLDRDALDVLGLPATLTVENGAPRVRIG